MRHSRRGYKGQYKKSPLGIRILRGVVRTVTTIPRKKYKHGKNIWRAYYGYQRHATLAGRTFGRVTRKRRK